MTPSNDDWLRGNAAPPNGETAATEDPGDAPNDSVPEERICEQCSSRLDPDQYYCLECGWTSELAPGLTKARSLGPLVAAGVIGLGLVGGGVAFAALQDDDNSGDSARVATVESTTAETVDPSTTDGGLPPDPTATTTGEELPTTDASPDFPSTTDATTATTPDFGTTTDRSATVPDATTAPPTTVETEPTSDWTDGQTAWTTIVSSVRSGSEASATKDRVRAAGEPAGVLFSTDHPELRPGLWVVFSGVFQTRDEASRHARDIGGQFSGAYVRRISKP